MQDTALAVVVVVVEEEVVVVLGEEDLLGIGHDLHSLVVEREATKKEKLLAVSRTMGRLQVE
jgi:hypothetical protein